MTHRLQSRAVAAVAGLAIVLTGCSGSKAPTTATSPSIAEAPSSAATPTETASSSVSETPSPSSSSPELSPSASISAAESSSPVSSAAASSSPAASSSAPSPAAAPPAAEVLTAFQAADAAYSSAFATAGQAIQKARQAKDLPGAQAGGRAVRDALFAFDAALRKIEFAPEQEQLNAVLLAAIGQSITALDVQNTTANLAAYMKGDTETGAGVTAVIRALVKLRQSLRLPPQGPEPSALPGSGGPSGAAASSSPAPAKFVSKQPPLSRAYVMNDTITDARAWRDDLLSVGARNADAKVTHEATRSFSFGVVEAWVGAFPLLLGTGIVGSAVEPPPSGISGFTVLAINSKNPPSATNPPALPFAVIDAAGTCAAGVLYGINVPNTGKPLTLPAGAPCTGNSAQEAAIAAGFE